MLIALFAAMTLAQAPETAEEISAPPKLNRARAILCSCAKTKPPEFMLQGLVVDAEMTLGPDGRKAAQRQATIFNVLSATEFGKPANVEGRLKIFHVTNPDECGVRFDYGKEYMVYARKTEEGAYETDYCLMNAAFDVLPAEPETQSDVAKNE